MKHHIKDGDRLIATIETHGDAIVVVHEPTIKLLTEKPAQMDYSHLVGKRVKYVGKSDGVYTNGLYYEVISSDDQVSGIGILDDGDDGSKTCFCTHSSNGWQDFLSRFDLSNPLDYNPDEQERIIPFDIERWRSGDFVRVQTRDGRMVEQLKGYDCIMTPLVGIIKGHAGVSCWHENGCYSNIGEERSHDIMLVVKGEGGKP